MRELTAHMSFCDAVLFLQIGIEELDAFLNHCADEVRVREEEDARVARAHERQMAMLDRYYDVDDWGRIFDEEMARGGDVRMPSTFLSKC